jgi:hypothetical protein
MCEYDHGVLVDIGTVDRWSDIATENFFTLERPQRHQLSHMDIITDRMLHITCIEVISFGLQYVSCLPHGLAINTNPNPCWISRNNLYHDQIHYLRLGSLANSKERWNAVYEYRYQYSDANACHTLPSLRQTVEANDQLISTTDNDPTA